MKGSKAVLLLSVFVVCAGIGEAENNVFKDSSHDESLQNQERVNLISDGRKRTKRSTVVDTSESNKNVCDSVICKIATSNMLTLMDHSADPCEDFYQFSCGGERVNDEQNFLEKQYISIENYLDNQVQNFAENSLKVYNDFKTSCMNYENNFGIVDKIKFAKNYTGTNLTSIFIDLILTQSLPIFDIGIDIGNNSVFELQLTLPRKSSLKTHTEGWQIMDIIRTECTKDDKFEYTNDLNEMFVSYENCINASLQKKALAFFNISKLAAKDITDDLKVDDLLDFIIKLQHIMPSETEIRQAKLTKLYAPMSINKLNKKYNLVNWKVLFEGITKNAKFNGSEKIQVYFLDYMNQLFDWLNNYNESQLVKILRQFYSLQLYENLIVPRNRQNKFNYCMDLTCQLMPDVTTIIVYKINSVDHKLNLRNIKASMLFQDLQDELNEALANSNIEQYSKVFLQNKLSNIHLGVITSGNTNSTKDVYNAIKLNGNSYPENVLLMLKNYRKTVYSLVNTKSSASPLLNYFVSPFYREPKSFYSSNSIVFHPTIFQKTSIDLPEYVRLAKLGLHFGRELAKHVDPVGRAFLINSDISSSNDIYESLKIRTNDLFNIVYLKSPYTLQSKNVTFQNISGTVLLNELIADNTAFRLLLNKFENMINNKNLPWINGTYSAQQIFFILAAQEYCQKTNAQDFMLDLLESRKVPSPIKIHNIISNSEQFTSAFDCADGSAMLLMNTNLITQFPYIEINEEDYSMEDYVNN